MKIKSWEMFRALGVETRLRIFEILKADGPMGVKELAEIVGITPAAVSQHLKVLRQAGLVTSERQGYYIPYSIDDEAMEHCRSMMLDTCSCTLHNHGFKHHQHHGPRHWCNREELELEHLKKYETRIEKELKAVRKRIDELRKKK
jgi:DNA-binding transcriptional ArsR family regulator